MIFHLLLLASACFCSLLFVVVCCCVLLPCLFLPAFFGICPSFAFLFDPYVCVCLIHCYPYLFLFYGVPPPFQLSYPLMLVCSIAMHCSRTLETQIGPNDLQTPTWGSPIHLSRLVELHSSLPKDMSRPRSALHRQRISN